MVKNKQHPLISVIIPTYGRPIFLCRAINSCLSGNYSKNTEVIVVANGKDLSWIKIRDSYISDNRISFFYSEIANQNIARNIGIENSNGKLIRFLDDDDYLIPENSDKQQLLPL